MIYYIAKAKKGKGWARLTLSYSSHVDLAALGFKQVPYAEYKVFCAKHKKG